MIKILDWAINKYVTGIQPKVLNKIINLIEILSKNTESTVDVKSLVKLGEHLEQFNLKEKMMDKVEKENFGAFESTTIRYCGKYTFNY